MIVYLEKDPHFHILGNGGFNLELILLTLSS